MLNFIPLSLSLVCSADNNDCREVVFGSYGKVDFGCYLEAILGGCRVGWCGDTKPIGYDQ